MPSSSLFLGLWSGLSLHRSGTCCSCQFIVDTVSLWSSLSLLLHLSLLFVMILGTGGMIQMSYLGDIQMSYLGDNQMSYLGVLESLSIRWAVVSLHVNHCLLWIEASLMKVEGCDDIINTNTLLLRKLSLSDWILFLKYVYQPSSITFYWPW